MTAMNFNVVSEADVPTRIRRRSASKWLPAVEALFGLEVGQALAFDVEDGAELARVRNGIRAAIDGMGIEIATRSTPNPTDDYPEAATLYIVKVDVEEAEETEDEE